MKLLLDQRATRIRQLESTLSKKREELDVSMETVSELLNASRESEVCTLHDGQYTYGALMALLLNVKLPLSRMLLTVLASQAP